MSTGHSAAGGAGGVAAGRGRSRRSRRRAGGLRGIGSRARLRRMDSEATRSTGPRGMSTGCGSPSCRRRGVERRQLIRGHRDRRRLPDGAVGSGIGRPGWNRGRQHGQGDECDRNGRDECNAGPHGTSLRWAREGAFLCSVLAGSGPSHSLPGRSAGRLPPSWLRALGCAAGFVTPRVGSCGHHSFRSSAGHRGRTGHERARSHRVPPPVPARCRPAVKFVCGRAAFKGCSRLDTDAPKACYQFVGIEKYSPAN